MASYLGVDIGGTKIALLIAKPTDAGAEAGGTAAERGIEIAAREAEVTRGVAGPDAAIDWIVETARRLSEAHGRFDRIGISCGGPLDTSGGRILSPPNLPGWDDVPITDVLTERLGAPARLMNDADAGAIAEHRFGAGRGTRNMVFLTFGTGIGAGIILNGSVYEGSSGAAGEIGHVRLSSWGPVGYGKTGSVEGFCSGGGIAQLAKLLLLEERQTGLRRSVLHAADGGGALSAKDVFEAATAGDALASRVVEHSADALGRTLSILVDILNPELIVLGGIYGRAQSLLRPALTKSLTAEAIGQSLDACRIVPAALGEKIGDYAAISVAMEGATP